MESFDLLMSNYSPIRVSSTSSSRIDYLLSSMDLTVKIINVVKKDRSALDTTSNLDLCTKS